MIEEKGQCDDCNGVECESCGGTHKGSESSLNDLLWKDISTAPKDGTTIIGWFVPNEVDAPEKAKPWITKWEMKQWKDGTGAKVSEPFGLWVTEGWRDPMSYAPTHWIPTP